MKKIILFFYLYKFSSIRLNPTYIQLIFFLFLSIKFNKFLCIELMSYFIKIVKICFTSNSNQNYYNYSIIIFLFFSTCTYELINYFRLISLDKKIK